MDLTLKEERHPLTIALIKKSKVVRLKDANGAWSSVKAYEFNYDKLRRIAKKYGYEFVTKLPSLPSGESTNMCDETHQNNLKKTLSTKTTLKINVNRKDHLVTNEQPSVLLPLSKLSNSVTSCEEPKKATLATLEDILRNQWQKGTTEDFTALIRENSDLNEAEITKVVGVLLTEGKIAYDPQGWLCWVK